MMRAIAFPFRFDTFGRATVTEDLSKIYLDRLYTLLSTKVGTRPMNPSYGTDVARALYENGGDEREALEQAIAFAIGTYLPILNLEKVEMTPVTSDGEMRVRVVVSFPDKSTGTVSVSGTTLLANGTIQ